MWKEGWRHLGDAVKLGFTDGKDAGGVLCVRLHVARPLQEPVSGPYDGAWAKLETPARGMVFIAFCNYFLSDAGSLWYFPFCAFQEFKRVQSKTVTA